MDTKDRKKLIKPLVIIILNEKFEHIGEYNTKNTVYSSDAFVSPEGLWMPKVPFNQEEYLIYDKFTLEKL